MSKQLREVRVSSTEQITQHMQRIILSGEELSDFPEHFESGYIKLHFHPEGHALTNKQQLEELAPQKPVMRTYSVRGFDALKHELVVDFVLHTDNEGPASKWAQSAQPGDQIVISGPGAAKLVNNEADWFLIAGDMTALPAISCNLEQLPGDAKGFVVIEIINESDIQDLTKPEGIEVIWVVNADHTNHDKFLNAVYEIQWLEGTPYAWCACEFSAMRSLRKYFKQTRSLDKKSMYISSYWKEGFTEDQHKVAKKQDSTQEESKA